MADTLAFQQRVRDEKQNLDEKLTKLVQFLRTPAFDTLAQAEKDRLVRQSVAMAEYSIVLGERIEAFKE